MLTHSDLQKAFVQSSLVAEICQCLHRRCGDKLGTVIGASQTLHGSRQSLQVWKQYLVSKLKEISFKMSSVDPYTFRLKDTPNPSRNGIIPGIRVDDILVASSSPDCDTLSRHLRKDSSTGTLAASRTTQFGSLIGIGIRGSIILFSAHK